MTSTRSALKFSPAKPPSSLVAVAVYGRLIRRAATLSGLRLQQWLRNTDTQRKAAPPWGRHPPPPNLSNAYTDLTRLPEEIRTEGRLHRGSRGVIGAVRVCRCSQPSIAGSGV